MTELQTFHLHGELHDILRDDHCYMSDVVALLHGIEAENFI
jgi:hypothetical protein